MKLDARQLNILNIKSYISKTMLVKFVLLICLCFASMHLYNFFSKLIEDLECKKSDLSKEISSIQEIINNPRFKKYLDNKNTTVESYIKTKSTNQNFKIQNIIRTNNIVKFETIAWLDNQIFELITDIKNTAPYKIRVTSFSIKREKDISTEVPSITGEITCEQLS